MYVEHINISQKSSAFGSQIRVQADKAINLKEENVEKPVKESDSSHVKALVTDVQNNLKNVDLHFSVQQSSGKIIVTVTEESSGKVIREIPSREILELAAKIDEMVGMIFDQKG